MYVHSEAAECMAYGIRYFHSLWVVLPGIQRGDGDSWRVSLMARWLWFHWLTIVPIVQEEDFCGWRHSERYMYMYIGRRHECTHVKIHMYMCTCTCVYTLTKTR